MADKEKQLRALGLAAKARKLLFGTDMICDSIRKNNGAKKVFVVVAASDISDNTAKKLSDKCAFYGVRLVKGEYTMDELSHAVGKTSSVAAVALTDENIFMLFAASL